MNCWLQEGVDRSSWTSESDEKEAKFMEELDGKDRWGKDGRLVAYWWRMKLQPLSSASPNFCSRYENLASNVKRIGKKWSSAASGKH